MSSKIDLIVIGNMGSGKTSLIQRYIKFDKTGPDDDGNGFSYTYMPTLGINLEKKKIQINENNSINLFLWDTAGQEKYFSLTKNYFQKSDGVVIVFDITDKESFMRIDEYWMEQVKEKTETNVKKILIGNKVDLQENRKVKYAEAIQLAQNYKMQYFETSAQTGEQVQEAFDYIAKQCYEIVQNEDQQPFNLQQQNTEKPPVDCFGRFKSYVNSLYKQINQMHFQFHTMQYTKQQSNYNI